MVDQRIYNLKLQLHIFDSNKLLILEFQAIGNSENIFSIRLYTKHEMRYIAASTFQSLKRRLRKDSAMQALKHHTLPTLLSVALCAFGAISVDAQQISAENDLMEHQIDFDLAITQLIEYYPEADQSEIIEEIDDIADRNGIPREEVAEAAIKQLNPEFPVPPDNALSKSYGGNRPKAQRNERLSRQTCMVTFLLLALGQWASTMVMLVSSRLKEKLSKLRGRVSYRDGSMPKRSKFTKEPSYSTCLHQTAIVLNQSAKLPNS